MTRVKAITDPLGVIRKAAKILPDDLHRLAFLQALAELEDNECHRTRSFPVTRLHKLAGVKEAVYRADIDKTSGWRLHCQYIDDCLVLSDVLEGKLHDEADDVVRRRKGRYTLR